MKKILVLIAIVCMAQNLFAQSNVIFEETFSNGLSGDGLNGVWTTAGSSLHSKWEYRGISTSPNVSVGSQGAYAGTLGPIVSSTPSNGFFIFDSDYLDNDGVAGNFGAGNAPSPHTSGLTSPSVTRPLGMNWSKITFHSYARRFMADMMILLSTNGGATWADTISIYDATSLTINTATDDDNFEIVTIPSSLQFADSLKIRFYFDGASASSSGSYGYYFWMIDDVRLLGENPNDLTLDSVRVNGKYLENSERYLAQIPHFLAQNDSITFTGYFSNTGANVATNSHFYQSVTGPLQSSTHYSLDTTLNSGDTVGLNLNVFTFSEGMGDYISQFAVESDSIDDYILDNLSDTIQTEVTDSVLNFTQSTSGNFWYGAGMNYELGNRYTIPDSVYATSIGVEFGDLTAVSSIVKTNIYTYPAGTSMVSSSFYFVSQAEINTQKVFPISPTILPPGEYIVTFETFTDSVFFKRDLDFSDDTVGIYRSNGSLYSVPYALPVALNVHPVSSCNSFVSVQVQNDSCGVNSGSINLNIGGGAGGFSYAWSSGATTSSISNLAGGTYHYTVTDSNSCSFSDSIAVISINAFSVNINQNAQPVCVGDSSGAVSVNGLASGYSFLWNTGDTNALLNNLPAGNYQVTVTDGLGCMVSDTITLSNLPYAGVSLPSDTVVCDNQSVILNVTPNSATSWVWNTGNTSNSETSNPPSGGNQTFWVTGSDAITGCVSSDTVTVTGVSTSPVSIHSLDTSFCYGESLVLSVLNPNGVLLWNSNSTQANIVAASPGMFSVTQTDTNGCASHDTVWITEQPELLATLNAQSNNICTYDTDGVLAVNASGGAQGYTYMWNTGDTASQIGNLPTGAYAVTITDSFGCEINRNTQVTAASSLSVQLNETYEMCHTMPVVIHAGNGANTWSWSTGATTNQINWNADTVGSFTVWVMGADTLGCTQIDSAAVLVHPNPVVSLGNDTLIVGSTNTYTLSPGSGFNSYMWSTGSTAQNEIIDASNSGAIWVEVTNAFGCASRDTVLVEIVSGVNQTNEASFQMYPNPATEFIRISGQMNQEITALKVLNANGQSIKNIGFYSDANQPFDYTLNVSELPSGVYFVAMYTANTVVYKPFVME